MLALLLLLIKKKGVGAEIRHTPPCRVPVSRPTAVRVYSSHGEDHLDKQEVVDRVIDVVKRFSKEDTSKVTPDVHFQKDLGLDSLDNVEIVTALEEDFKLEIPDKAADKLTRATLRSNIYTTIPWPAKSVPNILF